MVPYPTTMNSMCFRAALIMQCLASNAWAQFGPIQPVEYGIAEIQEVLTADLDLDGDQDIVKYSRIWALRCSASRTSTAWGRSAHPR